jgi:hypothetical protein
MNTAAELTEVACAAMWPLTMWVYGLNKATPSMAAVVGIIQYLALISLGGFASGMPLKQRPLLTGAHAGALWGLGRIGFARYLRVVIAQFAGSVAGFWLLEHHGVDRHIYWDSMRELRPAFWGMFAAQTITVALCAALSIALRDMPEDKHPKKGAFWDMCRSGIWIVVLCYPWGGPSGFIVAWRWIQILYQQEWWVMLLFALGGTLMQTTIAALLVQIDMKRYFGKRAAVPQDQPQPQNNT